MFSLTLQYYGYRISNVPSNLCTAFIYIQCLHLCWYIHFNLLSLVFAVSFNLLRNRIFSAKCVMLVWIFPCLSWQSLEFMPVLWCHIKITVKWLFSDYFCDYFCDSIVIIQVTIIYQLWFIFCCFPFSIKPVGNIGTPLVIYDEKDVIFFMHTNTSIELLSTTTMGKFQLLINIHQFPIYQFLSGTSILSSVINKKIWAYIYVHIHTGEKASKAVTTQFLKHAFLKSIFTSWNRCVKLLIHTMMHIKYQFITGMSIIAIYPIYFVDLDASVGIHIQLWNHTVFSISSAFELAISNKMEATEITERASASVNIFIINN